MSTYSTFPSKQNCYNMAWFMLTLLLLLNTTTCHALESKFAMDRKFVSIKNDLEGSQELTIHCKSSNDDLGVHVLVASKSFEFNFKPTWIGDTLFYCSFQWDGEFHYFDIYHDRRDIKKCTQCLWSIKSTGIGPCRFNFETNIYDRCYPWNQS